MKISSVRSATAFFFVMTIVGLVCSQANAQTESSLFRRWFHGGVYENQADLDRLYRSNARGQLGGLFAPGFTRPLTVLGALNYTSGSVTDVLSEVAVDPPLALGFFTTFDVDSGYALSFAFGRRHSYTLRSEIEVAFRNNNINRVTELEDATVPGLSELNGDRDGSINATSIMKNFIFDFKNESRFTPYAGFGIGISYVDIELGESISADGERTFQDGGGAFTYQAIGGVAMNLREAWDLIVEYRFLGTTEVDFGPEDSFAYNANSLFFGMKFEY